MQRFTIIGGSSLRPLPGEPQAICVLQAILIGTHLQRWQFVHIYFVLHFAVIAVDNVWPDFPAMQTKNIIIILNTETNLFIFYVGTETVTEIKSLPRTEYRKYLGQRVGQLPIVIT